MYKNYQRAAFVIAATLVTSYPSVAWHYLLQAVGFQNFLPLKLAFFSAFAFIGVPIYQTMRKGRAMGLFEGIPVEELLDHLYMHRTFKRDEVVEKFGIPRSRWAAAAAKLDSHGFFARGDNNERVLSEISREQASQVLCSPSDPVPVKILDRLISLLDAVKPKAKPVETDLQTFAPTDWKPVVRGDGGYPAGE